VPLVPLLYERLFLSVLHYCCWSVQHVADLVQHCCTVCGNRCAHALAVGHTIWLLLPLLLSSSWPLTSPPGSERDRRSWSVCSSPHNWIAAFDALSFTAATLGRLSANARGMWIPAPVNGQGVVVVSMRICLEPVVSSSFKFD
jgi:hypothetical protein